MAGKKPKPGKKAKKDRSVLMLCIFGAAIVLMLVWLGLSNAGLLKHLGGKKLAFSTDGLTEYQKVSCYDAVDAYYGYSSYLKDADGGKVRLDYDKNGVLSLATVYNAQGDAARILSATNGEITSVTENAYEYDAHGSMTRYVSTYGRVDSGYVTYDEPGSPVTYAYTYDDSGHMTQKTRTAGSASAVTTYRNTYDAGALSLSEAYDESGALTGKTAYRPDGTRKSVETYSGGQLTEQEQFDEHGNMTRHLFYEDGVQQLGDGSIFTYDYNSDGSISVKYDATDDSSSYNYYYVYEYPAQ